MDIESYIKDLDPDLQEKARACGSVEELIALADYVSEVRKIKHPMDEGVMAREGIEY